MDALEFKQYQNNELIKWPSGKIFSSYLDIFQATLSPCCQRGSHVGMHKLKQIKVMRITYRHKVKHATVLRVTYMHKLKHIKDLRITYLFILYTFHSKQNGKEDVDTLGTPAVRTVHVMVERSCSIYITLVAKRVFTSH